MLYHKLIPRLAKYFRCFSYLAKGEVNSASPKEIFSTRIRNDCWHSLLTTP